MEDPRSSNSSSFGTFLKTVQGAPAMNADAVELPEPAIPASPQIPTRMLISLVDNEMPVQKLMEASGMGLIDFAEALKKMRDAEFVEVEMIGTSEIARLTPAGARLAGVLER